MIKNILVGYSGHRGAQVAFRLAADLAHTVQGRLHVAYVEALPRAEAEVSARSRDVPADAFRAALADTMPEPPEDPSADSDVLDAVADRCREEGIHCAFHHLFGDPVDRLTQLARVADLVALGRHDEIPSAGAPTLGRVARHLVVRMPVPVLLGAREYVPVNGVTVVYEPTLGGGRTLNCAAEIALGGNFGLNVMAVGHGAIEPAAALEEARGALRAYHLDGNFLTQLPGGDPVQAAALTWNDPLLVLPAPPRGWLSRPLDSIRPALALPNLNVLLVP